MDEALTASIDELDEGAELELAPSETGWSYSGDGQVTVGDEVVDVAVTVTVTRK